MTLRLLLIILISGLSSFSYAEEPEPRITVPAGKPVTFTEIRHCLTNAAALSLTSQIEKAKEECALTLKYERDVATAKIFSYESRLQIYTDYHEKIVAEKDKTILNLKKEVVAAIESSQSGWWKIALATSGGLVLGIASGAVLSRVLAR